MMNAIPKEIQTAIEEALRKEQAMHKQEREDFALALRSVLGGVRRIIDQDSDAKANFADGIERALAGTPYSQQLRVKKLLGLIQPRLHRVAS
jgi:hypothetical protein